MHLLILAILGIIAVISCIRAYKRNKMTKLAVYGFILLIAPIPIAGLAVEGYLKVSDLMLNVIKVVSFSLSGIGVILMIREAYLRSKTDERVRKVFVFAMIMLGLGVFIFLMTFISLKWR